MRDRERGREREREGERGGRERGRGGGQREREREAMGMKPAGGLRCFCLARVKALNKNLSEGCLDKRCLHRARHITEERVWTDCEWVIFF